MTEALVESELPVAVQAATPLQIVASNRMEVLAEHLAAQLQTQPTADPLTADIILVPHLGIGAFIEQQIAARLGVAANLQIMLPGQLIHTLADRALGRGFEAWRPEALRWRLHRLLAADAVDGSPLAAWLDPAVPGFEGRRFVAARQLSALFDEYAIYRPDWLDAWRSGRHVPPGDDAIWQARIFNMLADSIGQLSPAEHLAAFTAQLSDSKVLSELPRLSLFGHPDPGERVLGWLRAWSRHAPVTIYRVAPTPFYWGELTRQGAASLAISPDVDAAAVAVDWVEAPGDPVQGGLFKPAAATPAGHAASRLLATLGGQSRQAISLETAMLHDSAVVHEAFVRPTGRGALGIVQRALLDLDQADDAEADAGADGSAQSDPDETGAPWHSLTIEQHADRRAEVAAARSAILAAFTDLPNLAPHEVAVLSPALLEDEALIRAGLADLPIAHVDSRPELDDALIDTFHDPLRLPQSSLTATEIRRWLRVEAFAAAAGLEPNDVALIAAFIAAGRARYALDDTMREALGAPPDAVGTWQRLIDRLALGYAMGGAYFGGVDEPSHDADQSGAPAAAKPAPNAPIGLDERAGGALAGFAALIDRLADWRRRLVAPATLAVRVAAAQALMRDLFHATSLREEAAIAALASTLGSLGAEADAAGDSGPLANVDFVAEVECRMTAITTSHGFLRGAITIGQLMPMRAVPFRVLIVIGLDAARWPRRDDRPPFDLIARHPRSGDRSRRQTDQQLLLDALLATRDRLHLSYSGSETSTDAPPIAAPLAALSLALRRLGCSAGIRDARPQAWPWRASAYRQLTRCASDFAEFATAAAKPAGIARPAPFATVGRNAGGPDDAPTPPSVSLHELETLLHSPFKLGLTHAVSVALPWLAAAIDDELDSVGLDRNAAAFFVDQLTRGASANSAIAAFEAADLLPAGGAGARMRDVLWPAVRKFARAWTAAAPSAHATRGTIPWLGSGPLTVTGRLDWHGERARLIHPAAGNGLLERLRAVLHREFLVAAGELDPSASIELLSLDTGSKGGFRQTCIEPLHEPDDFRAALIEALQRSQRTVWPIDWGMAEIFYKAASNSEDSSIAAESVFRGGARAARMAASPNPGRMLLASSENPFLDADTVALIERIIAPVIGDAKAKS